MTLRLDLPDDLTTQLARRAAARGHANVEEFVEAVLRNELEQDEQYGPPASVKFTDDLQLDALIRQGIDSGPAMELNEADWEERRQRILKRQAR